MKTWLELDSGFRRNDGGLVAVNDGDSRLSRIAERQ